MLLSWQCSPWDATVGEVTRQFLELTLCTSEKLNDFDFSRVCVTEKHLEYAYSTADSQEKSKSHCVKEWDTGQLGGELRSEK